MKKVRHCDLESFVLLGLFFERLKKLLCLQDELDDLFYMLSLAGICSNESAGETVLLENEVEKVDYVEYTPYGETWVDEGDGTQDSFVNYKFTSKELDEETGLYYFGARYLDPQTSRWMSCDPIFSKYLPTGDKEHDKNLPGQGGIFNPINLCIYNYAGNNPLKYVDPTGECYEGNSIELVEYYQDLCQGSAEATGLAIASFFCGIFNWFIGLFPGGEKAYITPIAEVRIGSLKFKYDLTQSKFPLISTKGDTISFNAAEFMSQIQAIIGPEFRYVFNDNYNVIGGELHLKISELKRGGNIAAVIGGTISDKSGDYRFKLTIAGKISAKNKFTFKVGLSIDSSLEGVLPFTIADWENIANQEGEEAQRMIERVKQVLRY